MYGFFGDTDEREKRRIFLHSLNVTEFTYDRRLILQKRNKLAGVNTAKESLTRYNRHNSVNSNEILSRGRFSNRNCN